MSIHIDKIRQLVEVFYRDGEILRRPICEGGGWELSAHPYWDFATFEYKPCPQRIRGYIGIVDMTGTHPPETTSTS